MDLGSAFAQATGPGLEIDPAPSLDLASPFTAPAEAGSGAPSGLVPSSPFAAAAGPLRGSPFAALAQPARVSPFGLPAAPAAGDLAALGALTSVGIGWARRSEPHVERFELPAGGRPPFPMGNESRAGLALEYLRAHPPEATEASTWASERWSAATSSPETRARTTPKLVQIAELQWRTKNQMSTPISQARLDMAVRELLNSPGAEAQAGAPGEPMRQLAETFVGGLHTCAGNRSMPEVVSHERGFAVFSDAGFERYRGESVRKSINEDAVTALAGKTHDGRDLMVAAAFDGVSRPAGAKLGPGQESWCAAQCVEWAMERIALGEATPEVALRDAVRMTQTKLTEQNFAQGAAAATTLTAVAVLDGKAHVVNVGDSRVLLVRREGSHETHETADPLWGGYLGGLPKLDLMDEHANVKVEVYEAGAQIGTVSDRKARNAPEPTHIQWDVQPGDRLVVATDGLWDRRRGSAAPPPAEGSNLSRVDATLQEIADITRSAPSVGAAAENLGPGTLDDMKSGIAKGDNLGLVVLEVPASNPPAR